MFVQLFDPPISQHNTSNIVNYFVRTFSRLRGIDVIRSIMSKQRKSLKLHTRQKMTALADPIMHRSKINQENNDHTHLVNADLNLKD